MVAIVNIADNQSTGDEGWPSTIIAVGVLGRCPQKKFSRRRLVPRRKKGSVLETFTLLFCFTKSFMTKIKDILFFCICTFFLQRC